MSGPADRLRLEVERGAPGEVTVRVVGELDLVTAPILRDELGRHEDSGTRVVLDLSRLEFVDSTGLVLLMETAGDGGNIAVRRDVSPAVRRLLDVTRTEPLFSWVDAT